MGRTGQLIIMVCLGLMPGRAWALGLEWLGGARDIQVTSTRRCTLVVTPPPGASVLPARWRLYWTGTSEVSTDIQFLTTPAVTGGAPVCGLRPPATEDEVLSHTSTVEFCGDEPGFPTASATYVVLIDKSVQAKLRVSEDPPSIGDDPAVSEVTVNGGSDEEYPPALRFVTPLEGTNGQQLGVVGDGLDRVQAAWLYGTSTEVPVAQLEILTQSATTLTLAMPQANAKATLQSGGGTLVLSSGEGEPSSAETIESILGYDPEAVGAARMLPVFPLEAKDFAFLYHQGQFHIFYMWVNPTFGAPSATDIRHAVSTNLYNWTQLPPVIPVRPGEWDGGQIWAPTIYQKNGTFFMYYTGVSEDTLGSEGIQRIGLATSTDLMNWNRYDDPVLTCDGPSWTYCDPIDSYGHHFRDPFVMTDPANSARTLMYFVSRWELDHEQLLVGAAATFDPAGAWTPLAEPFWCTDAFPGNWMGVNESPHLFERDSNWYLFVSTNSGHPIRFKYATNPLADSASWSGQYSLWAMLGNDGNTDMWIAPELLRVGSTDYLAVVNRAAVAPGIEIRELSWGAPAPQFSLVRPPVADVPPSQVTAEIGLACTSPIGTRGGIHLRVDLPGSGLAKVEIFDVTGRSVARLNDGWLPAGASMWTWNGRLSSGDAAGSGVYFARVRTAVASRSIRVALLR